MQQISCNTKSFEEAAMKNSTIHLCIYILVTLTYFVVWGLFCGFVLYVLWEWFFVPIFGVSSISIGEAWGLVLIAFLFITCISLYNKILTSFSSGWKFAKFFFSPIVILLVGLFVYLFVWNYRPVAGIFAAGFNIMKIFMN